MAKLYVYKIITSKVVYFFYLGYFLNTYGGNPND